MSNKAKQPPHPVRAMTFGEVLAEAKQRADEERARVEAMSPEARAAYAIEQQERQKELDRLLKELGPRGPVCIKV